MNQHDTEVHQYWVRTIISEAFDKLSDWESEFITNIKIRLENDWKITDNQENKLEQIYDKYTK